MQARMVVSSSLLASLPKDKSKEPSALLLPLLPLLLTASSPPLSQLSLLRKSFTCIDRSAFTLLRSALMRLSCSAFCG